MGRGLAAELLNELYASIPFQNAFRLLTKMPNYLLAKNIQKMLKGIKEEMKENSLDPVDCGPLLAITEDGLEATHIGQQGFYQNRVCVRAILSIPSFGFTISKIVFYFEIHILENINASSGIVVGLCTREFPLKNKGLGYVNGSIGLQNKEEIIIDGISTEIAIGRSFFAKGDVIGLGVVHHPSCMEYFFTLNGILIGKRPWKFNNDKFFPAVGLASTQSIRVNFGKDKWVFKEFGSVLE